MTKDLVQQMFNECGKDVTVVDVTAQEPLTRDLIKEIAMDIGKETVAYIEWMYPDAIKATTSTFRLSIRNQIYNEIMAAIAVTDEGKIVSRLKFHKQFRKHMKKLRKAKTPEEIRKLEAENPLNWYAKF